MTKTMLQKSEEIRNAGARLGLHWVNKGEDRVVANIRGKNDEVYVTAFKIKDDDYSWTIQGNAGIKSGNAVSLDQAKAIAEREGRKILDSKWGI